MRARLPHLRVSWALGFTVVALAACSGDATAPLQDEIDIPPVFGFGNEAPSGSHYNLNIIGVPKDKTADMTGNQGHRIFVDLFNDPNTKTKILLCEAGVGGECANLDPLTGFQVLDANGTDGTAKLALPDPDPDADGTSVYSVYARPLGTPGGHAENRTCGLVEDIDPVTGETVLVEICSMVQLVLDRTKGKQYFINATSCLLYIYADLTPLDGVMTISRVPIFSSELLESWWEYTNTGLKLAQLRFYPVPSTVPAPDAVVDCTSKGKFNG